MKMIPVSSAVKPCRQKRDPIAFSRQIVSRTRPSHPPHISSWLVNLNVKQTPSDVVVQSLNRTGRDARLSGMCAPPRKDFPSRFLLSPRHRRGIYIQVEWVSSAMKRLDKSFFFLSFRGVDLLSRRVRSDGWPLFRFHTPFYQGDLVVWGNVSRLVESPYPRRSKVRKTVCSQCRLSLSFPRDTHTSLPADVSCDARAGTISDRRA